MINEKKTKGFIRKRKSIKHQKNQKSKKKKIPVSQQIKIQQVRVEQIIMCIIEPAFPDTLCKTLPMQKMPAYQNKVASKLMEKPTVHWGKIFLRCINRGAGGPGVLLITTPYLVHMH